MPSDLPNALLQTLLTTGSFRIERIVLQGHASPDGFWYDQDTHEWVLLVSRAARLRFEGEKTIEMMPGSYVNWGIARIDFQCVDELVVRSMYQEDDDSLTISDDAMIAVAFAAVKLRGCCDGETRELALRAIERERRVAIFAGPKWKHAAERVTRLNQMAAALAGMPECVPSQ